MTDKVESSIRKLQVDTILLNHLLNRIQLQADDLTNFLFIQRRKHDDFVNTIQEFRPDCLLQQLKNLFLRLIDNRIPVGIRHLFEVFTDKRRSHITCHNNNGILEVDRTALIIRQSTVIQYLQQDIEYIRMSLFDFIKQDDRIRFPSDSFRQLTTFIISNVSRRRTDQTSGTELLLIFTHINTRHHILIVEQIIRQGLCQLRLTNSGCSQEDERTDRPLRILQSGTAPTNCVCNSVNSFVLTNDTLVQFLLQVQQFILFALQHLGNRNTGPTRNDFGDIIAVHLFLDHRSATLHIMQLFLYVFDIGFLFLDLTVTDLCYFTVIAFTFSLISFKLQVLDIDLILLDLVDQRFLTFPLSLLLCFLILQVSNLLIQLFQLLFIIFPLDSFPFNLQLFNSTGNFVQRFRNRIHLHTQTSCGFIHQVDCLIRQETIRNISG